MDTRHLTSTQEDSSSVCIFECNACLVGGTKTITVDVYIKQRSAKFVCVPEDVWYTKSIEVSIKRNTMS